MAQAVRERGVTARPIRSAAPRKAPFFVSFYRSSLGKKYVMAITGLIFMLYVFLHMFGNLKMFYGPTDYNHYAENLRLILYPILPRTAFLWAFRTILIVSLILHLHATYSLTVINHKSRNVKYQAPRHYVAANYASRTMRWSGIIILAFVAFHLTDLTWGWANPSFVYGDVYDNVVSSLQRVPIAIIYIIGNLALFPHLYHGAWSLFQSLGVNNPRFNLWRRWFAIAFATVVVVGNVSFPIAVQAGIVG
jgi:succinate dehydrogenase / fumarate reductase cytochrome b subunit